MTVKSGGANRATRKGRMKMAKPSVTRVKEWHIVEENPVAVVSCGTAVWEDDYWRVTPYNDKPKYFYGEMGYMDAMRLAEDLYWEAGI
jgi:hypothetical protein